MIWRISIVLACGDLMLKILMGLFLIVVGAMVSFIPPFIFGIPILLFASGLIATGFGRVTTQAVKGGIAAAKALETKPSP
ncbi:hypothetical protein [Methylobacterium indicum]|uniref:hypothetical protein n=1 Tax=Methylobacterium indicum TaxID=1775910 RepID=UPI00243498A5|nr:hypothetical protein [Methylobacterium indicum]